MHPIQLKNQGKNWEGIQDNNECQHLLACVQSSRSSKAREGIFHSIYLEATSSSLLKRRFRLNMLICDKSRTTRSAEAKS